MSIISYKINWHSHLLNKALKRLPNNFLMHLSESSSRILRIYECAFFHDVTQFLVLHNIIYLQLIKFLILRHLFYSILEWLSFSSSLSGRRCALWECCCEADKASCLGRSPPQDQWWVLRKLNLFPISPSLVCLSYAMHDSIAVSHVQN